MGHSADHVSAPLASGTGKNSSAVPETSMMPPQISRQTASRVSLVGMQHQDYRDVTVRNNKDAEGCRVSEGACCPEKLESQRCSTRRSAGRRG